jgi:protoporphyrinogen/coproporphyrinogen III oxidase
MSQEAATASGRRFAVVGLGISGLTAAFELLEQEVLQPGDELWLIDKSSQEGGVLSHTSAAGALLEHGAQGVLAKRKEFTDLALRLGLQDKMICSSPKARQRYLITPQARLVALSLFPFSALFRKFLTFPQWIRMMGEVFQPSSPEKVSKESLFEFFARRFGQEAAKRLAIPVATGIWAGGARQILAAQAFPKLAELELRGGIFRGMISVIWQSLWKKKSLTQNMHKLRGLVSFREGMITLPQALLESVKKSCEKKQIQLIEHFQTEVTTISKPPVGFDISLQTKEKTISSSPLAAQNPLPNSSHEAFFSTLSADFLILALPPWATPPDFFADSESRRSWEDLRLKHTLHGIVVVGFVAQLPADHRFPKGFGALAPEESDLLLGVLNVHDIFPAHAHQPEDATKDSQEDLPQESLHLQKVVLRVLLGGDRCPEAVRFSEEILIEKAKQELLKIGFFNSETTILAHTCIRWPQAIALPDRAWLALEDTKKNLEERLPGLILVGAHRGGAAVADCISTSKLGVQRLKLQIQQPLT